MRKIEIPRWLIAIPLITILLVVLFFGLVLLQLAFRDYSAHVANAEADAIAYRNKKISESVDDKVLAWERIRNCKE